MSKAQEIASSLMFWKKNPSSVVKTPAMQAFAPSGIYRNIFVYSYDGEKNAGEMGPIKDYAIDYDALRLRSWQAYIESEVAQTILKKFNIWIIGSGLKLQTEPNSVALQSENLPAPDENFNSIAEARFSVFAGCESSDYAGMQNLHDLASDAHLHSLLGGDVLVVLRYEEGGIKVQVIDGCHVQNPINNTFNAEAIARGNKIIKGIEVSKKGEHVAYIIRKNFNSYERIEAKGKTYGMTMAFMIYGLKYRIDTHRGMPLLGVVLETLKKLERYKEATVGSAEERQKVAYFIEHGNNSTGENMLLSQVARARDVGGNTGEIPVDQDGEALANKVAATTNKMAYNMPIDSTIKLLESKNELYFKDFYGVNIDIVCAAVGIPPNVAMSKYDSNFSASRAALKDWEHTINVNRKKFAKQFYQKIYNFWFEIEILKNKIQAPGYLQARKEKNFYVIDAYRGARFIGPSVPHIDPVKEVEAERRKLGLSADNIPLTTVEQATETLNGGDSLANIKQFAAELEESKKLKIVPETPVVAPAIPKA
jgi:hypothetical protein